MICLCSKLVNIYVQWLFTHQRQLLVPDCLERANPAGPSCAHQTAPQQKEQKPIHQGKSTVALKTFAVSSSAPNAS